MTVEQAIEMLALLKRLVEVQEGIALELSFFMQQYRENNSYARSVVIAEDHSRRSR